MGCFAFGPELLGFLVAGTETRELNRSVVIRSEASCREAREVCDEVRGRKLRSEKSGRLLCGCGQKKIDGFGDGEEVAARGGSVTVSGRPAAIWRAKTSVTLPREASMLPRRRAVPPDVRTICSAMRLVAPIMEAGATALSVESSTTRAWLATAAAIMSSVAKMLLAMAARGWSSMMGTCL